MNAVILQPSFLPWRGYFHLVQKADIFVFYDCVQYDKHGWRNRNIIKTAQGPQWISVPVHSGEKSSLGKAIKDISIVWKSNWTEKHKKGITQSYCRAPYFSSYNDLLENIFERRDEKLADFTCATTELIARKLGILKTSFMRSSSLHPKGNKTDRLLSILKQIGATSYLSGPSAKTYIESNKFEEAGIGLEYISYNYPEYPQLHGSFCPHVSILDLIFNTGPDAPKYIWQKN